MEGLSPIFYFILIDVWLAGQFCFGECIFL